MSGTITAAASSTKRPAQAQAGPSQPAVKRSKTVKAEDACPSVHADDDDEEEELVPEGEMDDAMRARIARKNARVIRNRESAQRSRNQRKQHLAWLEKRVAELESENRQLREGGSPAFMPASSSQSVRAVSPAHSVSSFATEIGLPIEVVSGSGGVSLASIAPPPSGLAAPPVMEDVKPTITPQPTDASLPALQLENAALRDRVSRLEDLLKHVVALSSFAPTTPASLALPLAPVHATAPSSVVGMEPAQWGDLLQNTKHARPIELGQTLSPVPKMNDPVFDVGVDLPISPPSFSLEENGDILACHSAAGEDGSVRPVERAESGAVGQGGADCDRVGQDQGLDLAPGLPFGGVHAAHHDQAGSFKIESAAPTADTTSLFDDLWDSSLSALAAQLEGQADLLDTNAIGNEAPLSGGGAWRLDQWDPVWA